MKGLFNLTDGIQAVEKQARPCWPTWARSSSATPTQLRKLNQAFPAQLNQDKGTAGPANGTHHLSQVQ